MNLENERRVEVVLSRRNLLALLHKLDMPGSARQLENNDCWEDGRQTPYYPGEELGTDLARTVLVLRCEDDDEHYGKREAPPGAMHLETEAFIAEADDAAGEATLNDADSNETEPSGG
jgi:hypothetical protein